MEENLWKRGLRWQDDSRVTGPMIRDYIHKKAYIKVLGGWSFQKDDEAPVCHPAPAGDEDESEAATSAAGRTAFKENNSGPDNDVPLMMMKNALDKAREEEREKCRAELDASLSERDRLVAEMETTRQQLRECQSQRDESSERERAQRVLATEEKDRAVEKAREDERAKCAERVREAENTSASKLKTSEAEQKCLKAIIERQRRKFELLDVMAKRLLGELDRLVEGGQKPNLIREFNYGNAMDVAKSEYWQKPLVSSDYEKRSYKLGETLRWTESVILCLCRLGLSVDVGVTKQEPATRLSQKEDKELLKKRMYALFRVEGKEFAKAMETRLQNYAASLKLEGYTNCTWAAGNGVVEGTNTIYITYWSETIDRARRETLDGWVETPNARPASQVARGDQASQDTLSSAGLPGVAEPPPSWTPAHHDQELVGSLNSL